MSNAPTYTIKPLVWEHYDHPPGWPESPTFRAEVIGGHCYIESPKPGLRSTWRLTFKPSPSTLQDWWHEDEYATREEAEAAADRRYHAGRIAEYLEEVK